MTQLDTIAQKAISSKNSGIGLLRHRGRAHVPNHDGRQILAKQKKRICRAVTQDPPPSHLLNSIKWNEAGLVAVIVQDIDTGEVLMQAYADASGIRETVETSLATFYSRSRGERWCKGETSGNFIEVKSIYFDCDRDSIVYLADPQGPSCHTGAHTCWFSQIVGRDSDLQELKDETGRSNSPLPSLLSLEQTIAQRKADSDSSSGQKKSWTAKLLQNPELLCSKVREEAGELCQTLEKNEGKDRAASEMADLLYHAMVLLNLQGVSYKDVGKVLRSRFGTSGIDEKASRSTAA